MKTVLCIIDGMTDENFSLARMPVLEQLANKGCTGLLHTTPPNCLPDTLPCVSSILGVPSEAIAQSGRGWVEALGSNIPVCNEDTAFRVTWVNVDANGTIEGFCASPPKRVSTDVAVYYPLKNYSGILIVHGGLERNTLQNKLPPHSLFGKSVRLALPDGVEILQDFVEANRTVRQVPIPWGSSFAGKQFCFDCSSAMITATPVVKGVGKMLGMHCLKGQGMTGDVDTDLSKKVVLCRDALKTHDFVVVHVGGADEAGHRKNVKQKEAFLRRVDEEMIRSLYALDVRLAVCSDHATSPNTGLHGGEAQPYFISENSCPKDVVLYGDELLKLLGIKPPKSLT